ncbi:ShlB/FhaC/HecB family hemolysin secretion/activation protein [Almyronema epifaneia]|uniref:ShlB/FhaC/HecB family hemolysin secretion/activation protein n=1 Tax=Almyronema epifaneia S1 TaxID=2991925 RepID=A0ABW6IDR8_9CYAN
MRYQTAAWTTTLLSLIIGYGSAKAATEPLSAGAETFAEEAPETEALLSAIAPQPPAIALTPVPEAAFAPLLTSTPALQTLPTTPGPQVSQLTPERDRFPQPLPPPEPLPPAEPLTPQPAPPPATPDAPETIRVDVTEIQVSGSTVFDAATLESAIAPFENQSLTLAELQRAADAVTTLYLQAGYITSRAILPNQTVTDGVVQITVIEGRLAEIQVEGTDRLRRYVRDRVALAGTQPLNQAKLEDQLRLLRADPLFDNVEASLRAGAGPGESILIVRVDEAEALAVELSADNYSPTSVGEERISADIRYRNPAGLGDELFTSAYLSSQTGSEVYELGYRVPLNAMNGTLQLRFAPSRFKIVDEDSIGFALNVRGSADVYEASFRQPLIRTPREELALSLGLRHRDGETLIADLIQQDSRVSLIQFGQDYIRRDVSGAWALRSQFSFGVDLFNATLADSPDPDSQFFSWLGQIQRVQLIGSDHLLIVQGDVQFASDSLLGSEQFIIGGGQSIRGYSQNVRAGDNGFRISVEDRITLERDEGGNPRLQVAPFVDMGAVWNRFDETETTDDNFLLGTGVGFIVNLTPQWDTRLDFGVPLVELNDLGDPTSRLQVYFNVNYRL